MKMTEEEAIAIVRNMHPYNNAIRTVCDALEGARRAVPVELECYDAGYINDFGGGDVDWWRDYMRCELSRAHDFYQSQLAAAPAQPAVDVANICNAYESGVGHNGRPTANINPYPVGSNEHEAYRIGATGTNHKGWPAPETAGDARDAAAIAA